ncbi:type I restriction endonuclease subunit R [Hydrogenophaga crocea]|uniref:type I restriction endonuclease subunit R n=1 Tax=Hydrogenophaga crocea TaxID=2716225 RepID=UPI001F0D623F|nr:type I restriction endonuclease [Hydrogenophaga crocea]
MSATPVPGRRGPVAASLALLTAMGWRPLSTADARRLRGGVRDAVLKPRLIEALQAHRFEYKGEYHPLSPGGIDQVVRQVMSLNLHEGLLAANERFYRLLTLGVTVTEFMPDSKKHQPTVPLLDWQRPEANLWDVCEGFELLPARGTEPLRCDLVACVNGLPLAVIECADTVEAAVQRQRRRQRLDALPQLHACAQLLLALGSSAAAGAGDARYGTTGTPPRCWARWHEGPPDPLGPVHALLSPDRLLELLRHFVLFDRRLGKVVARPHQVFGVRAVLARIAQRRPDGAREGGVLWHTTGSGKSFTMVFLTKALLLHPGTQACRVIVVTDRLDLESQLARNFLESGAFGSALADREGERARVASGRELARRIGQGRERIIFTLVQKFATASRLPECRNPSADLIVLVDEGHRSQGGEWHDRMRRALPRAAYLAFTGTPLLKREKTANRFGPILHAYTQQRAVRDGTVAPLLYEERKPRLASGDEAARRVERIARDIAQHFHDTIKTRSQGLKGQVATGSKLDAIRYQRCLDDTGLVSSAVLISPPERREGVSEVDESQLLEVRHWWNTHVGRDAERYEQNLLRDFGSDGAPDLLIVVDRLLTGFDEPRNTVLYIDKPLKEHRLIQAVARVNRLHEAKRHGLLVDYRDILRALDTAVRDYQDLATRTQGGYDIDDIAGLYRAVDPRSPEDTPVREPKRIYAVLPADTVPDDSARARLKQAIETALALDPDAESGFEGRPLARACYGIVRLAAARPGGPPLPATATLIEQARAMDTEVRNIVAEHSLNPQDLDAAVRQALLPRLFALLGLERARLAVAQVIELAREGLARESD